MAEYPYDARAYDGRYQKVYRAGAEFWEEPVPTEALVEFLSENELRKGSKTLDIGCGEGRDSVFLAKRGFKVVGVDVSPAALRCAKERSEKEKVKMDLLIADIVTLPMKDGIFELSVNIGCLNMLTIQDMRDRHLKESYRVLKDGGVYFSCNSILDQPTSVEEFYKKLGKEPGNLTSRKIKVRGKEREILLPIIAAWPKSKAQYVEEFEKAGFKVIEVDKVNSKPTGECCVLVAKKERQ